jgi:hypothetical protein
MKTFWNERYQHQDYVYGIQPNHFFEEQLALIPHPGRILLPCEGEGRNAVYAAKSGWKTESFDYSESGKTKALQLARNESVDISYSISDALHFDYGVEKYDVVAFIYAHFSPEVRSAIHAKAIASLKPGGRIIMEAFHPLQLGNTSGGPKDITLLYTKNMLNMDFNSTDIQLLETLEVYLNEGLFHSGKADIIRLVAIKH